MHKHASINRYYRLVWSHVHACWVAVAEGTRGRGKSASRKLAVLLAGTALSGAALAAPPGPAGIAAPMPRLLPVAPAPHALPTGPQVVAGQASVSSTANRMTVNQGSDKAILNWQSFDIGANAGVRFVQPGAQSVALNRVLGNDPSRIYGQLSANGKVFLVNGNGVLFGAGARVDVGGLVASSLALPDEDFLAGRYTFSAASKAGAVRNDGAIRTTNGGYVALLGPSVHNAGSIAAPQGSVAFGAGERIGIDLRGDGLVTLRVERGAVAALLENSGLVQADGGRVEFSAQGADALARATVNNTGIVQARGLVADGGSIRLVGDGEVHAGALDASSSAGKGGAVAVAGRFVALDGTIDAGGLQGGSVGVQADSTLSAAAATSATGRADAGGTIAYRSAGTVVESSSASADAGGATQGGSIAVQGDAGVLSSARYSARSTRGAGGRIDVSGNDVLLLGAQLDASGNTQGGLVRVGGAFQGGALRADAPDLARFATRWGQAAPILNAGSTFVNDGTAIEVGASGYNGQGGTAVVWSDRQTTMLGSVDARGAGAAGTVEISSKETLRHVGLERIALGRGGQLLLDPKNITIGTAGGASWTYQAILGNGYSGGKDLGVPLTEGAMYGAAVALNAAGDRLAVGAPGDRGFNGAGDNLGAVRLYSFSDGNFSNATLQGTIGSGYSGGKNLNVSLQTGEQFGGAVALNANATRLAVGAPGRDGAAGAVYLVNFADGQFAAPAVTSSLGLGFGTPNLDNAIFFGAAVALNATGDRLAAGSLYDTGAANNCVNCGAVYLFNNAGATPGFVKAIGAGYGVHMNLPADGMFGTALAFDSGGGRLAVGAIGVDNARGAVYLFSNAYGATAHSATFASGASGGKNLDPGLGAGDFFGSSVAFNSAGTRLAIGATDDGSGKVRIVDFADNAFSAPTVGAVLGAGQSGGANLNVTLQPSEAFGYALALSGAGDRLVVGSPYSERSGGALADSGTVRAFSLDAGVAGSLGFGGSAASSVTVDAATLAAALDNGTAITLQANNDITLAAGNHLVVGDGSGNGALTLQAGRSIVLNASITTGNANLTLVANETAANGVVDAYRDAGNAVITTAAGTSINAGSGHVGILLANGAGKTNSGSGAITLGGSLQAGSVGIKNLGTSANSNVVIGAAGNIAGTGNGLVEVAAINGSFTNNAGAAGINPGAGRYLVYSNNPGATLEGLSGYDKHYAQSYTGSAPAYAASGNWFLYSVTPTLTINAASASKTYDGGTALPALGYTPLGFIDGDTGLVLTGALGVTGFTKHAGTYAINAGTLGTSLGYAIDFTGANLTVNPRVLNATVGGINKTYDGNNIASVTYGDDRIGGDSLAVSGTARFGDKLAANGKTVTVTGLGLSGADAANYTLASSSASTSANIGKRVLNASATALDKTYDGNANASVTFSDDRVAGDLLDYSAVASFADKTAADGKTVTVTGIALGGLDGANYTLAATDASTSADIARRVLSVSAGGGNKTYDGTTAANVALSDDRVAGDLLSLSHGGAGFATKDAGDGKTVTVSGLAIGGDDAANYTLASNSATTTANIAKRVLNVGATGLDKTYDGSAAANVVLGDDRVSGDILAVTADTASFADKTAGTNKAIAVTGLALGGDDAANYTLAATTAGTNANIDKRVLNATALGVNKTYDGNASATVTFSDDRVAGDLLDYSAAASFGDKLAGNGKTVTVSGIAVGGLDAANYTLAANGGTATANIDRRVLSATAIGLNKTYDGTANATVVLGDDRVAGDALALSAASASFADKHAGDGKAISVGGLALEGADAANYTLASTTTGASANIGKRTLNASASALDKVYDGTTSARFGLSDDRVAGDLLTLDALDASFGDKDVGNAKLVTVSGLNLSGQDAANYTLNATVGSTTASITPRTLHVSATGIGKVYDGNTVAEVTLGDDRIGGDRLSVSRGDAAFLDKNAGSGKAIVVDGIALGGQDAHNYVLASSSTGASADIARRTLHVNASGVDKVYDGSVLASVVLGDDRLAGDRFAIARDAGFADKNVGNAKTVAVSGLSLSGQDSGNYALAASTLHTSAAITPKSLVARLDGAVSKVYDGSTAIRLNAGQAVLDGFVAGEGALVAALDAHFDSANVLQAYGVQALLPAGAVCAADGTLLSNYLLPGSVSGAASITPKALSVVGMRANAKVYDGTTAASLASIGTLDGLVAGESLQLSGPAAGQFDNRNAGSGKTVTASGYALADGANGLAANYALAREASASDGVVTQATLTVKANDAKRAAGMPNPVFGYSVSGLMAGDTAAILPRFVTATEANPQSPPGSYAITVRSPATLQNYRLAYLDGVLDVTGAAPELIHAIRSTIAPVLPVEVTGGASLAKQEQRALPRVEAASTPGTPAPAGIPRADATVVTLSGGTEVLTRNGGVRTTQ